MAISDKLTYLNETKSQLKDMINNGLDDNNKITSSTTFRNYVSSIFNAFLEALRNPDTLFTNLPKKSGTGSNITLNDTANAPMRIELGASELSQSGTPTPSSPQAVHTISGSNKVKVEGKNLIDVPNGSYTMTNYWYRDFATNKLITSDMVGKKISFSYDIDIESISTTSTVISGVIGRGTAPNGMSSQIATATYSPTTGEQHIKIENKTIQEAWVGQYLVVRFAGFNVRSDCTYNYSNVQIEYGETASNFEPYISQEADIDLSSKNLFNPYKVKAENSATLITTPTGFDITRTHGSGFGDEFIASYTIENLKANTIYTFNFNVETELNIGNGSIYVYSDSLFGTALTKSNYASSGNNHKWNIKTSSNGKMVIGIYGTTSAQNKIIKLTNVQLEEGSTKTSFMEYFDYGEYCKIGNYEDKFIRSNDGTWQLKKNIGKVVLDGNTILKYNGTAGMFYSANQTQIPNYKASTPLLSNYLQYSSTTWVKNCFGITSANVFWLYIENGPTSLADLQTWLSTHNLDIRYVLNTPTYTQITGTLENQLENVYQKLLSYTGTTNISQVNNDLSFNLSVSAIEE